MIVIIINNLAGSIRKQRTAIQLLCYNIIKLIKNNDDENDEMNPHPSRVALDLTHSYSNLFRMRRYSAQTSLLFECLAY